MPQRGRVPVNSTQGLPHDWESERVVLGTLMGCMHIPHDVRRDLHDEYFSHERARYVWQAMCMIDAEGKPIDVVSVVDFLAAAPEVGGNSAFELAGGMAWVLALGQAGTIPDMLPGYIRKLREVHLRRQTVLAGTMMIEAARSSTVPATDLARAWDAAGERLRSADPSAREWVHMGDLAAEEAERMERRMRGERTGAIPTGMPALDAHLGGGLIPGDLVVLGGRPAMGKTAFALSMAIKAARVGVGVGIFSLELVESIAARRVLAQVAQVSSTVIKTGQDFDGRAPAVTDIRRVVEAVETIRGLPMMLNSRGGQSLADVRAGVRKVKAEMPTARLFVVDYLQIMALKSGRNDSRANALADTAQGLRNLAKEEDIAMLVLSQLNRDVDKRDSQKPCNADLRDSGGIEAAATHIWFPWRQSVLAPNDPALKDKAELLITKATDGPTGSVPFRWHGAYQEFAALEQRQEDAVDAQYRERGWYE